VQLASAELRLFTMNRERQQEEAVQDTADVAVEHWLHAQLTSTFNDVLAEPIPDELLRLLEKQIGA